MSPPLPPGGAGGAGGADQGGEGAPTERDMPVVGVTAAPSVPDAWVAILAGGGGARLWPASRRTNPKQLLKLGGATSLLRATAERVAPLVGWDRILIVTARDQAEAIAAELPELGGPRHHQILAEPGPRNTAGAVGLAASFLIASGHAEAPMAVLPSDAFIADADGFRAAAATALRHARDTIVTIGIKPTHPETGFGYVQVGAAVGDGQGATDGTRAVARFVEKPDLPKAKQYLASGDYWWNAGMFFLTPTRFREEAARHLPKVTAFIDATTATEIATRAAQGQFEPWLKAVADGYPAIEAISIDYGIMEKATGLRVVPGDFGWNDVGSWSALRAIRTPDDAGNVMVGDVFVDDSNGSIVVSEPGAPFVGVVGAHDLVVVATKDGVLVVPREQAQDVRKVVDHLKSKGRKGLL